MKKTIRIALAQINTCVGDLIGNEQKVRNALDLARDSQVDLIAFPELTITGYPPEDLLMKPQFVSDNIDCMQRLISATHDLTAILGFVDKKQDMIFNAATVLHRGEWYHTYHKIHLPNYGVFDEKRYFQRGSDISTVSLDGITFGLNVCEDIWVPESITECQALCGDARIILNISSSPYHAGKVDEREQLLISRAERTGAYICYVNVVGGQDELVFDGHSLVIDPRGKIVARGQQFEEDFIVCDITIDPELPHREQDHHDYPEFHDETPIQRISLPGTIPEKPNAGIKSSVTKRLEPIAEVYQALVLGVRDYVQKNGFSSAVLGLSGGIDSALTAAIACDALDSENVIGISMPSRYSSEGSLQDARELAANLNMPFHIIPIKPTVDAYTDMFKEAFKGRAEDITEENIQARIRGNIVMAFSNKFGCLALTTGNKSEVSVGYCTLYGDMAGGFNIIKDVSKTQVYQLARFVNRKDVVIPESTLTKPPSAELKPGQKDEDSLPPYDILDRILEMYVERDFHAGQIAEAGFDPETVHHVIRLVDLSEYKRRQAAPGVKITPRAFGKDRRMPITNRYRNHP
ncbi:NAD+ synthase [candidate division KSB1 bacterium]|nr:NAD+ synthase [candidate division KSB1 bacterium]